MPISSGLSSATWTDARASLVDRLALLQAGGAGELTIAGAALIPRLAMLAAGGAGELTTAGAALLPRLALLAAGGAGELTAARAALLSNLDAAVSGRLGAINSIQTGAIGITATNTTQTATVTAVNTSRYLLLNLGASTGSSVEVNTYARIALTNSTTITATREGTTLAVTVQYLLIDFAA